MYDRKETTLQAAARLGLPELFTAMHEGRHVCIDGRHYNVSCLITDPDCDHIARRRMGLPAPALEWTADDSAAASREGWDLFDCQGSAHGPLQLQAFDDPEPGQRAWEDDTDAWLYVATVASELHAKALAVLAVENLPEAQRIVAWARDHAA